jgi:hypothetical protein
MAAAENMSQVIQRLRSSSGLQRSGLRGAEVRVPGRRGPSLGRAAGMKTQVGLRKDGVSDIPGMHKFTRPRARMQNKTLSPSVVYVCVCFALGGKEG